MNLWFDMTHSLVTWKGGVVGIVRAELEIAKNLKKCNPNLKISVFKDGQFQEVSEDTMEWLWKAQSVGDAYIEHFGRKKGAEKKERILEPEALKNVKRSDEGRLGRIYRAEDIFVSNAAIPVKWLLKGFFSFCNMLLKSVSKVHMKHKKAKENEKWDKIDTIADEIEHPYSDNDIVLSVGWLGTKKEEAFSYVRDKIYGFKLVYLIYDLVLVNKETQSLFGWRIPFENYLLWISSNCDYVLYGGLTAKEDAELFWKRHNKKIPDGQFIKFGSEISNLQKAENIDVVRKKYNLETSYILTVGTVDAKKNQDILYRAYTMLARRYKREEYPQLVIVGGKSGEKRLIENIKMDPLVKDKITIIQPSDDELVSLYQNCMFTLLPSLYEGWSLTLPESLNYDKLCIASDVRPLREVGGDYCEYVDPYDAKKWMENIMFYYTNKEALVKREQHIKERKNITWKDCASEIYDILNQFCKQYDNRPVIYFDLSIPYSYCFTTESVSGIMRTELLLARKLNTRWNKVRFFAIHNGKYVEISNQFILDILDESLEIDKAYKKNKPKLQKLFSSANDSQEHSNREGFILLFSVLPQKIQNKILLKRNKKRGSSHEKERKCGIKVPFKKGDIVFSAGTGFSELEYKELLEEKKKREFKFCQLIYDFTPILVPQTHKRATIDYYKLFLDWTYQVSDIVFYGGRTAREDGESYVKKNQLEQRPGQVIRFGSDVSPYNEKNRKYNKLKKVLKKYGINRPFILAVGTIQPRKNYDTLYLAYLRWLEETSSEKVPQLVFAGYHGWNTEDFLERVDRDDRMDGNLIICSPNDKELDILYRYCKFTLLASLYEGWSLTLPQSLNYGKFCIVSDVRPLRETGGDFVDYVDPLDIIGWKDKMKYYYDNENALSQKELHIRDDWHSISWDECADKLLADLLSTEKME